MAAAWDWGMCMCIFKLAAYSHRCNNRDVGNKDDRSNEGHRDSCSIAVRMQSYYILLVRNNLMSVPQPIDFPNPSVTYERLGCVIY